MSRPTFAKATVGNLRLHSRAKVGGGEKSGLNPLTISGRGLAVYRRRVAATVDDLRL